MAQKYSIISNSARIIFHLKLFVNFALPKTF